MDYRTGIKLDPSDEKPLFQQIADQVAARARSGAYPVGFRLPPTRNLAKELGTHRNTVVRAFEELGAMGVITSTVGRGTFIAARPQTKPEAASVLPPGLAWGRLLSRRLESGTLARVDRLAPSAAGADVIQLHRMQPSADLLPSEPFRRSMEHVLRATKGRALGYAPREGLPALRQQIADGLSADGVPVRAEDVLITSGSQQALDLLARAFIDPGDTVVVEAPSYSGAINVFAASGASLYGVPWDEQGPGMAYLDPPAARGAKLFYLMPNCRNPTGTTVTEERREEILRWSRQSGVPLVEDDYGADLNLDGTPPPAALRSRDPDVLYMGTFSKKLIPALRVGYIVCPAAIRGRLISLKHAADLGTSLLLQAALSEFLDRGYLKAHLHKTLAAYRARRDALEEALSEHLPAGVEWSHVERGVLLWLRLPRRTDPDAVFRAAERRGVLVTPGSLSSPSDVSVPGVRLTFCAEPPERLREGARRLGLALREVLGQHEPRRGIEEQLSVV